MRLVNDTAHDAELLRSETPSGRMLASLVLRVAYRVDEGGGLAPLDRAAAPAWAGVRRDRVATAYGDLDPDLVFPRAASDLMIFGDAVGGSAGRAEVRIEAGPYRHVLSVSGERRWERGLTGGLRASPPLPFARIPLNWESAYGGAAAGPHGPIPCPSNPRGRGYYLEVGDALGQPLPSVEWAGEEVAAWDDRPEPAIVGPYPSSWWLRLARVWRPAPATYSLTLDPAGGLFDQAHPRLSGRRLAAGERLVIEGMGPRLAALLPACPARVEWILGDARCPRELAIDELIVDVSARIIALGWRKIVQYEYVRHQERRAILTESRP